VLAELRKSAVFDDLRNVGMSPVLQVCHRHGLIPTKPCPQCKTERDQRRDPARNLQPHRVAHRTTKHRRLAKRVFRRDGYRCVDCGTTKDLTLDYLVPLQDGGRMDETNAETRCRSCNARAGRRTTR
jgi:5-methylcytosine-specific restriction endonuclease McrA